MRSRVVGRGYPGHGAILEKASVRIAEYIQHRQQREEEVLRVLRYGKLNISTGEASHERQRSWTSLEIVQIIYQDTPTSLHQRASQGVQQLLTKLEGEGRVVHDADSGRWYIE